MKEAAVRTEPPRAGWRPGPPVLGMLAGWVALVAWSGMVAQPVSFLVPTLVIGLVLALVGSWLRVLRVAAYAVVLAQVAIALLALNVVFAADQSRLVVFPTLSSVRQVAYVIGNGAATLNQYSAPVEVNPTHTAALLTAAGLGVLLSIDVLAMGLRRPSLVALPLLITLSVPVSILTEGLALPVFVGTALLFLRLLATENLDGFGQWAAASAGGSRAPLAGTLWTVSTVAVLASLLLAPLVPVTDLLNRRLGAGEGQGGTNAYQLSVINPFIRLRRDLVTKTHTPMVFAETDDRNTGYLRTTVLDSFTGKEWRPSARDLPSDNSADGVFPNPPGLAPAVGGQEHDWGFQLAPGFTTTWLPLPYPIRELKVPGTWRFDSRTLDVASVGSGPSEGLEYAARSFTPAVTADLLRGSLKPPDDVVASMTRLPADFPAVITARAKEVTRDAPTPFDKAVALQDWFRQDGGFEYSLQQRPGSGMDLLASFVTDDRVGYCEQFASAMAAMGRALNIPSRVVVGFLDGTSQPDGRILYTSDERHAWPEMYFSGVGWVRFEPTPSQRAGATPDYTRQGASAPTPSAAPSAVPDPATAPPPDQAVTDGSTHRFGLPVPWWSLVSVLAALGLALAPGALRGLQRRRRLATSHPVHLAEGAWSELRSTALDLGLQWPDRRTPREQARTVTGQVTAGDAESESLEALLTRVERGRYGRADGVGSVEPGVHSDTVATVTAWRKAMGGSVDRRRGWRGRLWPASLLRRRG